MKINAHEKGLALHFVHCLSLVHTLRTRPPGGTTVFPSL